MGNLLYKAIIEVNPNLKWESINWNKYKPTTNGKRSTPPGKRVNSNEEPRILSSKQVEEERKKFTDVSHEDILDLKGKIKKRIIGQDEAVSELCDAINIARVGLRGDVRPIGSFLLVGTTGVGKTELSKVIADELNIPLIRIDCSEYQSEHEIAKLFGSPPGYVGHESDNERGSSPKTLASKVRKDPYSVVLFDEIEKAHERVFNVLLQIMDEGHITSGRGDTIKFNETVILMTSNVGTKEADNVCSANRLGFGEECLDINSVSRKIIDDSIHSLFKVEFLNRLTKIIYFECLSEETCKVIVDVLMEKLKINLEKAQHMTLVWTDHFKEYIVKNGFSAKFGARNIERTIDKLIALPLANKILTEHIPEGSTIELTIEDGELQIVHIPPKEELIKE